MIRLSERNNGNISFSPGWGQVAKVTVSGNVKDKNSETPLPYVNVVIKSESDSLFVGGTVTNEKGLFTLLGFLQKTMSWSCHSLGTPKNTFHCSLED